MLDPFSGIATTGIAALKNKKDYIGIELNPKFVTISEERLSSHLKKSE